MPGRDGTGPLGTGPIGGGRGFCGAGFADGGRQAGRGRRARMNMPAAQPDALLRQKTEQLKARLAALEQALGKKGINDTK